VYRIAAVFATTPLSFRKTGQCLPRALAANALCRRSGVTTTLVFGVRLAPFAAHCWLQRGSAVIVGDLEQARMFIPILAVP
jgi:transglutaminase-like putative cysteine protease